MLFRSGQKLPAPGPLQAPLQTRPCQTEIQIEDPAQYCHINLQIEPAERANMKIIMDPSAGDYISAYGTGNLRINFFNQGNFQMFGNYNITEGIYKMSMQNVIRKDFTLQPGGVVSFNGDPKAANLNVQAVAEGNRTENSEGILETSSKR